MNCPVCGSRAKVLGTVYNPKDQELYRKRRCCNTNCWHHFYTVEFEVTVDKHFIKEWNANKSKE